MGGEKCGLQTSRQACCHSRRRQVLEDEERQVDTPRVAAPCVFLTIFTGELKPLILFFFFFVFLSFCLLGPHWQHMGVPRLGVQWESNGILNPLSEARDQTHVLMDASQVH